MAGIAPPALVAGAPFISLPYGLFSVLSFREGSLDRWENGVEWDGEDCNGALGLIRIDCDPELVVGLPKTFVDGPATADQSAQAFTLYGSYKCNPVGNSVSYAQRVATQRLERFEEGSAGAVVLASLLGPPAPQAFTPSSWADAIGVLEDHMASTYGGLGVIHTSYHSSELIQAELTLKDRGGRLFTPNGTPVALHPLFKDTAGATYDVAITPPLFGYRSEVFTSSNRRGDLLDRDTNDLYAVAERTYVIGFDTCGLATAKITRV